MGDGDFNSAYTAATALTAKPAWVWAPLIIQTTTLAVFSLGSINRRVFTWFNGSAGRPGAPGLWSRITVFGDSLTTLVLVFPLIKYRPEIIWSYAWAVLFTTVVVHALKRTIKARRPPAVLGDEVNVIGPRLNMHAFPSGHSATVFSLCGVLVFHLPDGWLKLAVIALSLLVAVSRMVIGVHWPMDILAGAVVGWGAAWAGVRLTARLSWIYDPLFLGLLGGGLLIAAAYYTFFYDTRYPLARHTRRFIGLAAVCLGAYQLFSLLAS